MSDARRYRHEPAFMVICGDGDYVLESKYLELKAENEELRSLLKQANVHVPCNWPLRNLINATLISSPENP